MFEWGRIWPKKCLFLQWAWSSLCHMLVELSSQQISRQSSTVNWVKRPPTSLRWIPAAFARRQPSEVSIPISTWKMASNNLLASVICLFSQSEVSAKYIQIDTGHTTKLGSIWWFESWIWPPASSKSSPMPSSKSWYPTKQQHWTLDWQLLPMTKGTTTQWFLASQNVPSL